MIKILLSHNVKRVVTCIVIGVIIVYLIFAIEAPPQAISNPKIDALEAVSKITEYLKQKEMVNYYRDYIITSIVYGRPDQLNYAPSQAGSWQVDSNDNEASWFITLTNSHKSDIQVFRLKSDNTFELLSHLQI
jgi:hypothetical protein